MQRRVPAQESVHVKTAGGTARGEAQPTHNEHRYTAAKSNSAATPMACHRYQILKGHSTTMTNVQTDVQNCARHAHEEHNRQHDPSRMELLKQMRSSILRKPDHPVNTPHTDTTHGIDMSHTGVCERRS